MMMSQALSQLSNQSKSSVQIPFPSCQVFRVENQYRQDLLEEKNQLIS